jgi:aspartyl-tRNA(Asn)/glutamyl-tRNA(Gln) amidotransferase subunit C
MGKIDRDLVRKLGELAHLSLTDEECDGFTSDIEQILGYAERLRELSTEGVQPKSHALVSREVFRDDEPRRGLSRDDVLDGAPDDGDGLFKVPRVLP